MAFLLLGILLLTMKLAEFGPVALWSWWWVLLPFGLAVAWWGFVDATGMTQRRAIDKMERTKEERRNRNLVALGLGVPKDRKRRGTEFPSADAGRRAAKAAPPATDEVGRR
ncbi:MAG: TIGR04438 family Trp-rich protein [Rubrivivax sp.]|nr:TIGR04438 family Trp-rich protein [Rubrivivax sp.]